MEITIVQIYIGIITLLTQLIEALTGFGATAVGLPFAAIFMHTSEASAVLNTNAFIVSIIIVITKWKQINWREYGKIVLLMLPFLPIGFFVGSSLKAFDMYLKLLLGLIMVLIAGRYIFYTYIRKALPKVLRPSLQYMALFSGAVIHGIYTAGGPLVTLYTANKLPEKGEFRATMCAVFTTVNIVIISYRLFFAHMYTEFVISTLVISLPFLSAGILMGFWIHKKIHNHTFGKIVYLILLAGGIVSLYGGITAVDWYGLLNWK